MSAEAPTYTASFGAFSRCAADIATKSKRLDKAARLSAYFNELDDHALRIAARFAAGQIFAQWDKRRLRVGGALLIDALAAACATTTDAVRAALVRHGDLGDVAVALWPTRQAGRDVPLTHVLQAYVDLVGASGKARKLAVLAPLLEKLDGLQACYVLKLCSGELRIGLAEGAVEEALARAAGQSVRDVQRANMLLGDLGECAYLSRHGQLERARMRLFHPLKFMLASPVGDAQEAAGYVGERFVVEDKYDGIRMQAHVSRIEGAAAGQPLPEIEPAPIERGPHAATLAAAPLHGVVHGNVRVALFTRTLDEVTASFLDIVPALAACLGDQHQACILDGELLPVRDGRILPFAGLQKRLGVKKPDAQVLAACPVALVAYDCLFCDGEVLLEAPFTQRREALCQLLDEPLASLQVTRAPSAVVDGVAVLDEMFAAARARRNEGLMLKRLDAPYKPGRRGRDWLKLKRPLATLDVAVTSVEHGSGRRAKVLSDYTFAVRKSATDATLLNIGKAYSGLTDVEIAQLTEHFRAHTLQTFAHGRVCVVTPNVVIEVAFDRIMRSARHKSGFALRFPRISRLRPDKRVAEIDTLDTVEALCAAQDAP